MSDSILKQFLSNIHPFLDGDDLGQFISELTKIPNYEKVFETLINEDPAWLEEARKSQKGVSFFLETVNASFDAKSLLNELSLRRFHNGECPTIKVTKYIRRS